MNKFILGMISLCLATTVASCTSDLDENGGKGQIAGSVNDYTTGEPVSVVNVSMSPGNNSTVTGSDGTFIFEDITPGSYTINISKEGYTPSHETFQVNAGQIVPAHLLIERIPAEITADKSLLDFGEDLSTLSFKLVNRGYTDLHYSVEAGDCRWISLDPSEGVLQYAKTATVIVKINRDLLASGDNSAMIVVRSSNGGGNTEIRVRAIGEYKATASVNTLNADQITNSGARLNGEITNEGAPRYSERGFVWHTQQEMSLTSCTGKISVPVTDERRFSSQITLKANTTYYARAYVKQNGQIIYGNTVAVGTAAREAALSMSAASGITSTSATLTASITDAGSPEYTERGFCYAVNVYRDPTVEDVRVRVSGSGSGAYSATVTGLTNNTSYKARAYLIQNGKTVYSNAISFATKFVQAEVTTSAATNVTATSARLNGMVTSVGDPVYTQRGFCYRKGAASYSPPTISDTKLSQNSSAYGNYYLDATGLESGATYGVRAYVIQDGDVEYGDYVSFTTVKEPRIITGNLKSLQGVSNGIGGYSSYKATFQGMVYEDGNPEVTLTGFVYSTTRNPRVNDGSSQSVTAGVGGDGEVFTANVSNLSTYKTYYVRAWGKTANGYYYGDNIEFQTF